MIKNVKKNIKIPKSANTERLNGIKIAPFITKINYIKNKIWKIIWRKIANIIIFITRSIKEYIKRVFAILGNSLNCSKKKYLTY